MRVVSAPWRIEDGRTCWDGIQIDVTEQRDAEARERENEALLAAVIESANDAIVGVDARGRITLFNPSAARIFRYPAASIIGKGLAALLPAETLLPASAAGAEAPLNLADHLGASRVRGLRSDGVRLELEMSVSELRVNGQQYFTAILRDITDRVRTERSLVQYQVELTELTQALLAQEKATASRLAQVLHDELGQTLAAIRIEYVDDVPLASPEEQARHARVDRLIDQAVREVRQVLAELRPTILEESGLYQALKNDLAGPRMSAEGVAISLAAPAELRTQRWDPSVEYAAFMVTREAIANAVRHARASEVRVNLAGDASRLRVEVRDNGAGFEQATQAARPGHLGMIGMRERSIAIGARFDVTSAPGRGTTVVLAWQERDQ
jgi:PAS domain S-box-containing protein